MSLESYSSLKSDIANWMLGRSDLATDAATFVAMTESDINLRLRIREMEETAPLTPVDGVCELPADYLAFRSVRTAVDYARPLDLATQDFVDEKYFPNVAGTPRYFTIDGSDLTIYPMADTTVTLRYYRSLPPLTDAAPTNWLLTKYPSIYLLGSLQYAALFLQDASAQVWAGLFNGKLDALATSDRGARWARAGVHLSGPTP